MIKMNVKRSLIRLLTAKIADTTRAELSDRPPTYKRPIERVTLLFISNALVSNRVFRTVFFELNTIFTFLFATTTQVACKEKIY